MKMKMKTDLARHDLALDADPDGDRTLKRQDRVKRKPYTRRRRGTNLLERKLLLGHFERMKEDGESVLGTHRPFPKPPQRVAHIFEGDPEDKFPLGLNQYQSFQSSIHGATC